MEAESKPFYYRTSLVLLMLSLIALIIYVAQDIIVPFSLATLLAILLIPLTTFLERLKIPRVTSIFISVILSFVFLGGIIYFLSTQILSFLDDIPVIKKRIGELIFTVQKWLRERFNLSFREQATYFKDAPSGSSIIGGTFSSLTGTLFILTLLPIYTFLLLYYRVMLKKFLIDVFKDSNKEKVEEIVKESRGVIQNYMVGLLIEMGIVASLNFVGFLIIGIKYPIFLAVFAAVLNLIPYIGMLIASIFCALVTLTSSPNTTDAVWTLVVLIVIQFFDNNILMPRIVGSKVKINALMTILGVLIGGALCGIPGMFLAIPGVAILKVIFERVDELKPWGMLLSDDITHLQPGKIYTRLRNLGKKPKVKQEERA